MPCLRGVEPFRTTNAPSISCAWAPMPTGFITKIGDGGPPGVVVASIPVAGLGWVNEKPSTGRTS